MRIGDVSRPRRFANPARLRWYAFHRSVRFALRMMKAEEKPSQSDGEQLQLSSVELRESIDLHACGHAFLEFTPAKKPLKTHPIDPQIA